MSLLSKEQEKSIISFLKENYKMPSYGLVGGQAVASLIYKELGLNINTPINDVDIFQLQRKEKELSYSKMSMHSKDSMPLIESGSCSGGNYFELKNRRSYNVTSSYYLKEDLDVNIVLIKQYPFSSELDNDLILESFDFNCCSVGFDIKTSKFYMTSSFVEFIKSKQLRIQSVHTPFHSALRLNKKIKDLGENVFCNISLERSILFQSKRIFTKKEVIGQRFMKLYNEYKDSYLEEMIEINEHINEHVDYKCDYKELTLSENFISLVPKREGLLSSKLNNFFNTKEYSFDFIVDFKTYVHFFHLIYKTNLFKNKYVENIDKKLNQSREDEVFELFYNSILFNKMSKSVLNPIKIDISDKKVKRISKVFNEHPILLSAIDKNYRNENIEDIFDVIYEISKKVKRNKKIAFLYGLIETGFYSPLKIKSYLDLDFDEMKSKTIDLIDRDISSKIVLKKEISFTKNFSLKQLVEVEDFYKTGKEMNNCLLGHFPSFILNKDSYYFSIVLNGKKSALCFNSNGVVQHFLKENKRISLSRSIVGDLICILVAEEKKENITALISKITANVKYKINSIKKKKNKEVSLDMDSNEDIPF